MRNSQDSNVATNIRTNWVPFAIRGEEPIKSGRPLTAQNSGRKLSSDWYGRRESLQQDRQKHVRPVRSIWEANVCENGPAAARGPSDGLIPR
jgi:hypothetical protein